MQLKSRIIALPLAAVLASGAFFHSAPAQAAPKSKTYKAGAVALGALGAYFLSKGKTVEGAAALGGGYLAYKQGEKERKNEQYGSNYNGDRYGDNRYDNGSYNDGRYNNDNTDWNNGDDYRYDNSSYDNQGYSNPNYSNYANGSDPDYREVGRGNGRGRSGGRGNGKNQKRGNGRSWQR